MTEQRYSAKEALNRIFRTLIGQRPASDIPGEVTGEISSEDEALSKIAELLADSLPNETFYLPTPVRIGAGDNYTKIGADGAINLYGTAKAYRSSTFVFNYVQITGQGKPTLVNQGAFFGFSLPIYNNDNEELFSCLCMPSDWDGTTDPIMYLGGWLDTANDDKYFNLQVGIEVVDYNNNEVVPVTTNDYEIETHTGTWAQYTGFIVAFTIDASAIGLGSGKPLAIRIRRIARVTGVEIAGEVVIEGAMIQYIVDKLGDVV